MFVIRTPRVYIKIFNKIEKIIKDNIYLIPDSFRNEMIDLELWYIWVGFIIKENSYLSSTQRRKLSLNKFINYCKKNSTDLIEYHESD